ncbi:tetratricopeptide repeat protein [Pontiella sulfatireligans]|uniref:Tetratricopeptide repeat protein n=1 Tax=Pontiella sulfatireligans TaxID=2750658 RepID=A0A6C2UUI9_9BACT|nr:hypothetical protein [Pontiella sulfatireligans]VGO22827.1 hypothetical protein SCARR_04924 [Pontiella sulfatireligans]
MRPLARSITAISALACSLAHGQYAAKVTVNSGNSFVVKQLNIQGDRLKSDTGLASTSLSMIKSVEFRFSGINLNMCETMFRSGDRNALESLLKQYVGPVAKYSYLSGNMGDYLLWMLRVQYWNGKASDAANTAKQLIQTNVPEYIDASTLYSTMMLLDQGKPDEAQAAFSSVADPEALSVPMAEYIRGKLALEAGEYRDAMKHTAQIVAFHSLDPEWMAPATGLEALIYQQTGQLKKADTVATELMIAYPGTRWSKLGETIKKETTGTSGG